MGKIIGEGGNGIVHEAISTNGEKAALKIFKLLKEFDERKYIRFKSEIEVLTKQSGVQGIIPILDYDLPPNPNAKSPAWYVMPIAKPIMGVLSQASPSKSILAINTVANTLCYLHSKEIYHRDIKPDNILSLNNVACLSDFGLVDFKGKENITKKQERMGAKWTVSPEMERDPLSADGAKADVYSLAKSLWMILTRICTGFEGQYIVDNERIGLQFLIQDLPLRQNIDSLLLRATDHSPEKRPTMQEFHSDLDVWLAKADEFEENSIAGWDESLSRIFPAVLPKRAFWEEITKITSVLKIVGKANNSNHVFFPNGGGLDLKDAFPANETGCIKLDFNAIYLLKPKRLIFESFEGYPYWSYFRLETETLSPSGASGSVHLTHEDVLEISPGEYIDRCWWDEGSTIDGLTGQKIPIPKSARIITRVLKGDFVIFPKASWYNEIADYTGKHNLESTDSFRLAIEQLLAKRGKELADRPPNRRSRIIKPAKD